MPAASVCYGHRDDRVGLISEKTGHIHSAKILWRPRRQHGRDVVLVAECVKMSVCDRRLLSRERGDIHHGVKVMVKARAS